MTILRRKLTRQQAQKIKARLNVQPLNSKALAFINSKAKTKVYVGGRGAAKSFTAGANTAKRIKYMPKAKYGLVGSSYNMLKNNTLPSFMSALKIAGYREAKGKQRGHFVMFKKPPSYFDEPWEPVHDYDNVISFWNGYTIQLISWYDMDKVRGKSLDGADIDEAALFAKEDYDKILFPAIRGNKFKYEGNSFHYQICFYTSMPWLASGQWVLDYQKYAQEYPKEYFFITATSWDNKKVIGEDVLRKWKREMNPLEYKVEIMCQSVGKVPNNYYVNFSEAKHCYSNPIGENEYDLDLHRPLCLSFDFNGNFKSCLVYQEYENELRFLKEFFVKDESDTAGLARKVAEFYDDKMVDRKVQVYGDRGGYNHKDDNTTLFDNAMDELWKCDFHPELLAETFYHSHQNKYLVINESLKERPEAQARGVKRIRINRKGCINLIVSLTKTRTKNNFEKDKSDENKIEVRGEWATHLPDAFDYGTMPFLSDAVNLGEVKVSDVYY